jgi:Tfp pilus assembly protein FimT
MGAPVTTTELVVILFIIDILVHLAVSIAVGFYLHSRAKSASVEIGNSIMEMVPAISSALAENVADRTIEKLRTEDVPITFWERESVIG